MSKELLFSKTVWCIFSAHTALVFLASTLSLFIPYHPPQGFVNPSLHVTLQFADQLLKWDAHWYTYIAENGYDAQSIVFFPVIVALIKLGSLFGLSYAISGFLICNLFSFLCFYFLYIVVRLDYPENTTFCILLSFALMPTSFFLNSIYTEPIFLTFTFACVYFTRTGNWLRAGISAALAALTRNIGVFLLIFMLYEYWHTNKSIHHWSSFMALFLAPLALCGFMLFNLILTGDALAFVHSQQYWGRYFGFPWINIANNVLLIAKGYYINEPGILLDTLMVFSYVAGLAALTFMTEYAIRPSYLLLGWTWFLIPLFSTSSWLPLYSISRFVLVVFPIYFLIGRLPKMYFYSYLLVGVLTLSICTIFFSNWRWIG